MPPQIPTRDPDMFLDSVIAERHHVRQPAPARVEGRMGGPRTAQADAAFVAARKGMLDDRSSILGVLWRAMHAPDIAKFTGVPVGTVCTELLKMEAEGLVQKEGTATGWDGNAHDLWGKVIKVL